jgi:hypothetical protein
MTLLLAAILPVLAAGDAAPPGAVKLPPPRVQYRPNEASATRSPWIDANGWQLLRAPAKPYYYDVPANAAALAAAEAFAHGASAVVHTDKAGAVEFNRMLEFLRTVPDVDLPVMANIGVIDDGSDEAGELMNLLSRRNLLYKVVPAPDPKLQLNVRSGSKEDPNRRSHEIRAQLGDEKRLVRLYGSEVVIARLIGNGTRARLHILNYANRPVNGLRVRLLGAWAKQNVMAFGKPDLKLTDVVVDSAATEFTIPEFGVYVVIDLSRN